MFPGRTCQCSLSLNLLRSMDTHHVCPQVNAQDGDGAKGQRDVGDDEQQERGDLWNVTGQGVGNGLLQVVEDQAACRMETQV